jgi:hypothetical protein
VRHIRLRFTEFAAIVFLTGLGGYSVGSGYPFAAGGAIGATIGITYRAWRRDNAYSERRQ